MKKQHVIVLEMVSLNDLKNMISDLLDDKLGCMQYDCIETQVDETERQMCLSSERSAKMLKVDVRTLYNWSKEGLIKKTRIGGRVFYQSSDIEKLMRERGLL